MLVHLNYLPIFNVRQMSKLFKTDFYKIINNKPAGIMNTYKYIKGENGEGKNLIN